MRNPLLDSNFLKQLDEQQERDISAKIILLTFDELPIEEIQGKVTTGSISLDGDSAVRRTCSLTMVSDDINPLNTYWTLKNKFRLEIGIRNRINPDYPDIIWFNQGMFVFSSLNMSISSNSCTINLQGRDKMVLLNGELGGKITAQTDFGAIEEVENTNNNETIIKTTKLKIIDIVRNAVNIYAGQPLDKIIINDIDPYGLELLEYRGDSPIYAIYNTAQDKIDNVTYNTDTTIGETNMTIASIPEDSLMTLSPTGNPGELIGKSDYKVIKISFGDTCGYRLTDLVYPGDLVCNVGENITTLLDKIKSTFSDFEYFFDIDGNFVFQKKKTYINTSWNSIQKHSEGLYADDAMVTSKVVYTFNDGKLLTNFSSVPDIGKIKNDFSIWGQNDSEIKIHMRYAIHKKPVYYKDFSGAVWVSEEYSGTESDGAKQVDWRELIYQMAKDQYQYAYAPEKNFYSTLAANNPDYYPEGITGYENYYIDMISLWRLLYCPSGSESEQLDTVEYAETGWNKDIETHPEKLTFWIDFLDAPDSEIEKYSISAIGNRPKTINNNKIKAIYYKETPQIVWLSSEDWDKAADSNTQMVISGYTLAQLSKSMENMLTISAQGISAQEELDTLLYDHTYLTEQVTMNSIPIYHLQPNSYIAIQDNYNGINGEYIISKMSIPLQYNGLSSITVSKAVERLY